MKGAQFPADRLDLEAGFTLIELVVVIVLVGLFLPAMFTAVQTGLSEVNDLQASQQQLCLAEAAMEEIMADCRAVGRGFTFLTTANYSETTGLEGFTRSVEIQDTRVEGRPAKAVTVRIMREGFSDVSLTMTYIENW